MKWLFGILVPVVCVALTCGAVLLWHAHERATEHQLFEARQARAKQGDAISQYHLALMYQQGGTVAKDYSKALSWYHRAANQGNAKAQYAIGYMYYEGEGVPQSYDEALIWYRRAADQGNAKAQYALGLMFYEGHGVPQNRTEAARWYRQAAVQGLARAQYDLGYLYYYGQGVTEDRTEANHWFQKAADQGDRDAQHTLGVGLTLWRTFILLGLLIGGILLTVGLLIPRKVRWSVQTKRTTIAGVLCFFSAVLNWYGYTHYEAKCLLCGSGALSLLTWTVNGILIILLITVLREGIKVSVWMSRQ